MSDNPMFLYAGEYENVDDAKADLETLKELHREHIVGTYDAAVVTKDEEGGQGRREGNGKGNRQSVASKRLKSERTENGAAQ